jgi:hypothetical protein
MLNLVPITRITIILIGLLFRGVIASLYEEFHLLSNSSVIITRICCRMIYDDYKGELTIMYNKAAVAYFN